MNPNQFVHGNVILHESVKNQILGDSTFSRVIYSNNLITTNGFFLKLDIKGASIDKRFGKTTVQFNIYNNNDLIAHIQTIEQFMLSMVPDKTHVYNIYNELASGRIVIHNNDDTFVLKISGIWETDTTCGLTYKFVCV